MQETQVQSLSWEDPLEKEMATHSSILPGEFHGQRSLVGYSSRGHKESVATERPTLSLSLLSSSPLCFENASSLDPIGKNPSPDSPVLFAPKEWERMYVYCSRGGGAAGGDSFYSLWETEAGGRTFMLFSEYNKDLHPCESVRREPKIFPSHDSFILWTIQIHSLQILYSLPFPGLQEYKGLILFKAKIS